LKPQNNFSFESDVYAYGIVMWQILTFGEIPFDGFTATCIRQCVKTGDRPDSYPLNFSLTLPSTYINLMKECWQQRPENRPSFSLIVGSLQRLTQNTERQDQDSKYYLQLNHIKN